MLDKIMVATDGSETSARAAKLAVGLAGRLGGKITAVYVVDVVRLANLPGYTAIPGVKDRILNTMIKEGEEATGYVEELARKAGVPFDKLIVKGSPSDELLKLPRSTGTDLLVMGSVGRSGLGRFLLGSVAAKVSQHSVVPVLLVPGTVD